MAITLIRWFLGKQPPLLPMYERDLKEDDGSLTIRTQKVALKAEVAREPSPKRIVVMHAPAPKPKPVNIKRLELLATVQTFYEKLEDSVKILESLADELD
jgi:hypothetical protein